VIPTVYEILDDWRGAIARRLGRRPAQQTAEHRVPVPGRVAPAPATGD
jgi:hypothetical protein